MDESLVISLGRLPAYVYLADLFRGRRVLELGCGEGSGAALLARCGAASVIGVDRSGAATEAARARHRQANLSFVSSDPGELDYDDRSFDVVCIPDGAEVSRGLLEEARRVLAPQGLLVLAAASADRPDHVGGARGGVGYHDLRGRLEPLFGVPRMIGVTPFVGCALVEFGEDEVQDLELDGQLAALGAGRGPVTEYIAVAGPVPGPARGYLVVELPAAEGLAALGRARGATVAAVERPLEDRRRVRREDETTARHAEELAARDAQVTELRRVLAEAQAEIQAPRIDPRLGELEGALKEAQQRLAEKTAAADKLTRSWKEAEVKSDELWRKVGEMQKEQVAAREQGVETARQQRQAAQVALTRAVEEASKKLISTQDNLARTERQRRELETEAQALKAQVAQLERERDNAVGERDALKKERDVLKMERDTLRPEKDSLRRERDALHLERAGLRVDRDSAGRDRDTARAERDGLRAERDGLRAERDAATRDQESLRAELATLRGEHEALRAEHAARVVSDAPPVVDAPDVPAEPTPPPPPVEDVPELVREVITPVVTEESPQEPPPMSGEPEPPK